MEVVGLGVSVLKGAAQEHPDRLRLDARGPVHDRRFALVDPVAARVLRTVENPRLMSLRARTLPAGTGTAPGPSGTRRDGDDGHDGDVLVVEVPGHPPTAVPVRPVGLLEADYWGRPCRLEVLGGPAVTALTTTLSTVLGREVVLCRAGRRDVVYGEGVTLVTTSSLVELERRRASAGTGGPARPLEELLADAERWRATLAVRTDGAPPFVEDGWHGRTLRVGPRDDGGVTLRVTAGVARCAVVRGRPRDGAREDWDPLRLLADDRLVDGPGGREVAFAVGAEVEVPGEVALGDRVVLGP
ncbi:hypothetical protein [Aquipuribacter hungaricus]|uniref:MOSC domain-containing protein n=1 Tax=Aquipuribacter hungaricus TaxID=545624 RepID=A0ABV7WLC1_9MICO